MITRLMAPLSTPALRPPAAATAAALRPAARAEAADRVDVKAAAAPPDASRPIPDVSSAAATGATPGPVGTCLRLILAGPPGAGKTTHGTAIAKAFGIPEISMGNLLRAEVKSGSDLGKQIDPYLQRGDLVPIEIVSQILEKRLSQPDAGRGFILDGIPRRLDDAHLLEGVSRKMGLAPIPMLLLDVPDSEILGRVENRRVCDNQHVIDIKAHPPQRDGLCDQDGLPLKRRPDDEPEVVAHRLEVYHSETQPVIDYYQAQGLLFRVDGVGAIEAVSARALETARQLATPA